MRKNSRNRRRRYEKRERLRYILRPVCDLSIVGVADAVGHPEGLAIPYGLVRHTVMMCSLQGTVRYYREGGEWRLEVYQSFEGMDDYILDWLLACSWAPYKPKSPLQVLAEL